MDELEKERAELNDAMENQGADFINLKSSFHETQEVHKTTSQQVKSLECELNLMKFELQGCHDQLDQKESEIEKLNQMLDHSEEQMQQKNKEIEELESRNFIDQHADYIYNMSNKYLFKKR